MKILENTAEKLVLRYRPPGCIVAFMLVWASGFAGMPLMIILSTLATTGVSTLTCQKPVPTQMQCQLEETGFNGLVSFGADPLGPVKTAEVEQSFRRKNKRETERTYRVVLQTGKVKTPIMPDQLNREAAQVLANKINQFQKSTNPNPLVIRLDYRREQLAVVPFLLIFVIVGLTVLWFTLQSHTYTFERSLQRLQVRRSHLFGKSIQEYPWQTIVSVVVEPYRDSKGRHWHRLRLHLANGKTLNLDNEASSNNLEKIRHLIRQHLDGRKALE